MKAILLSLILLPGCTSLASKGVPKQVKTTYAYVDASGRYGFTREHKLLKNKLISRTQISSDQGSAGKPLEKSVMVSELGTVKERNGRALVMRPAASEFTVWLEGKRYDSKMRLDPKTKSMIVDLTSPEEKWKGRTSYKVPRGKLFCFFSQIPDCLYHNQLLAKALERRGETFAFIVVWDSFPYVQEQFSGVGMKLFAPAVVKYDGDHQKLLRYEVEVDGQTLFYHFSKSFDLVKMLWIAQGISIIPPNEQSSDIEE